MNWGGARPGSGPKTGSRQRLSEVALDIIAKSKKHPLEYLMEVMNDESAEIKLRLDAAYTALPYCVPRLSSTEINVNRTTDGMSQEQLLQRYLATQSEILRFLPKAKMINGTAERVEVEVPSTD